MTNWHRRTRLGKGERRGIAVLPQSTLPKCMHHKIFPSQQNSFAARNSAAALAQIQQSVEGGQAQLHKARAPRHQLFISRAPPTILSVSFFLLHTCTFYPADPYEFKHDILTSFLDLV